MTWTQQAETQDAQTWRGQSLIFDIQKSEALGIALQTGGGGGVILALGGLCLSLAPVFGGPLLVVGVVCVGFGGWALKAARDLKKTPYKRQDWELIFDNKTSVFSYKFADNAASLWTCKADEISRVETSKTVDWETVRDYNNKMGGITLKTAGISQVEYQTFFVMHDTSRRVIYTYDDGREMCATLAASIRAAMQNSTATAPPPPSSSSPRPSGFDL